MAVIPPLPRFKIEEDGYTTQITIPSRKNWFVIFFLGFWLSMWTVGEFSVLGVIVGGLISFVTEEMPPLEMLPSSLVAFGIGGVFTLAWLGAWTAFGVYFLYSFFWQIIGKEIIKVNRQSVTIIKKILWAGRPKEYPLEYIKDLRITTHNSLNWFGWSRANRFRPDEGIIGFDYGAKTFHLGSGLDEAEAKLILQELRQHFSEEKK